jgi:acyl-CoA dehydrogenase
MDDKCLLEELRKVCRARVMPHADAVDRDARFPGEAISALREIGALAAPFSRWHGGPGASVQTLSNMCAILGAECASTAMIVAMHFAQVISVSRHAADSSFFSRFLSQAAARQLLLASGTSEFGTGGDITTSVAAVVRSGSRFRLDKRCTVLSYGEQADGILITARRTSEAAQSDQVFVLLLKGEYELHSIGSWDALGMRGTCGPPVRVVGEGHVDQILVTPFRDVAQRTLVPISHLLWSSVWLGMAKAAISIARAKILSQNGGDDVEHNVTVRLARAVMCEQIMRASIDMATQSDRQRADLLPQKANLSVAELTSTNSLKILSSELVWKICHECLAICGISGYLNQGSYSLGRLLRDALAAPLMVSNDRIEAINSALVLLNKDLAN